MSWVRLNMRFPGTCLVCRKRITAGEQALWSRGVGVKHVECAQDEGGGVSCMVCGGPAGCATCELADSCDTKKVSLCICTRCNTGDAMAAYVAAVSKKFPALSGK